MNYDEAISSLSKIKQDKSKEEQFTSVNNTAKALNTFKNIIVKTLVDLVKILLSHEPRVTVKNHPSQKEIIKLLKEMNTHLIKIEKKLYKVPLKA